MKYLMVVALCIACVIGLTLNIQERPTFVACYWCLMLLSPVIVLLAIIIIGRNGDDGVE